MLASNLVLNHCDSRIGKTAEMYYKDVLAEYYDNMKFVQIIRTETDDGNEREISVIIDEICSNIREQDVVYIDGAGGKRTVSNVIQLLTKILHYKGIQNPLSFYSDIQGTPYISDTADFLKMTNLADAFNEFMTSGKADQLERCIGDKSQYPAYAELLSAMCEFSDKVRMGDVATLDDTILSLRKAVGNCRMLNTTDSIETVIINQFLSVIESRLIASQDKGLDYLKIVQWCLDNGLLQQALTLFTEKIPTSIFDNKLILFSGNISQAKCLYAQSKKSNSVQPDTWEHYVMYTDLYSPSFLMSKGVLSANGNSEISEFREALEQVKNGKNEAYNQSVREAIDVILSFKNYNLKSKRTGHQADWIRAFIEKNTQIKKFETLIVTLSNEPSSIVSFLNPNSPLPSSRKKNLNMSSIQEQNRNDSLQIKIDGIERMKETGKANSPYSFGVPVEKIVPVLYAYLYCKATRNQINHASSKENLSATQKQIFETLGYDFSATDFKTIVKNVQLALDSIMDAIPRVETLVGDESSIKLTSTLSEYATTLKVGDLVGAYGKSRTVAILDGYDYDIPLKVPKFAKPEEYFQKSIEVRIVKISSRQQITMVELVSRNCFAD